jgi:cytochrome c-type biogenesis protein
VLVAQPLQEFTRLAGLLGNSGHGAVARIRSDHLAAQFALGELMGVAWSPCVGPTLGAAIALAAGGSGLADATLVMATFSIAAVIPLTAAGLASRAAFGHQRERMARVGQIGRHVVGWSLLLIGALIVGGWDKQLEAWLLSMAPEWLLALTTRF